MPRRTKAEEAEERGGRVGAVARRGDREGRVGLAKAESSAAVRRDLDIARRANVIDPFAGKTKGQIRVIQRQLGFTGRDVDGIAGPKTRAAWDAAQQSGGAPDVSAIPVTLDAGAPAGGLGGGGGGFAGGGGGAPAFAPPPLGDVDAAIRERFPALAALMGVPEMAAIMREAVNEGWPESRMLVRAQQTEWWRATPAKTRAWIGLQALDPATAQRQVTDHKTKLDQLRRAYFVEMSDETLAKWAEDDLAGRIPADGFLSYAKEQAKSLFPHLASAIDRGITVAQYSAPYWEIAARTLEISPDSIDPMDPRWNKALVNTAPTGERVSMSLSDWQAELRSNPTYGYDRTVQARQQAAEFATQLGRTFGKVA